MSRSGVQAKVTTKNVVYNLYLILVQFSANNDNLLLASRCFPCELCVTSHANRYHSWN